MCQVGWKQKPIQDARLPCPEDVTPPDPKWALEEGGEHRALFYHGPVEGRVFCQKLALWPHSELIFSCQVVQQKVFSTSCLSHLYGSLADGNKIFTIWNKIPIRATSTLSKGCGGVGVSRGKQLLPSCG